MNKLNVLVTGGAGFIGSHIVDKYIHNGYNVFVLDNLSTGKLKNLNKKAEFIEKNICDKNISEIFKKIKFDIVNHHAAQINVRKSSLDPIFDANVNIFGTLNLLENAKNFGVKKFIFASSGGAIYGDCDIKKNENSITNPESPYAISKMTSEFYIKFFAKNFGINYIIFRYANVYGQRQNYFGEAGVVAVFFNNIIKNFDIEIFGNGEQIRDYIFVKDIALFNQKVLELNIKNEIINIGTGIKTSVNNLFLLQKKITGYKKNPKFVSKKIGDIKKSILDIEKMNKIFKIKSTNLEEGLKITYDFYKNI